MNQSSTMDPLIYSMQSTTPEASQVEEQVPCDYKLSEEPVSNPWKLLEC